MSDRNITIVPQKSIYPDKESKAIEILDWLISLDIVKPVPSDCILSAEYGYAISNGAKLITNHPDDLPFGLFINGLEIITQKQVFDTGQNGIDELICPHCQDDISSEDWNFLNDWYEQESDNILCPLCKVSNPIHQFKFTPKWGFSNLGFRFWNWPDLKDEFVNQLGNKLGCNVSVVYQCI